MSALAPPGLTVCRCISTAQSFSITIIRVAAAWLSSASKTLMSRLLQLCETSAWASFYSQWRSNGIFHDVRGRQFIVVGVSTGIVGGRTEMAGLIVLLPKEVACTPRSSSSG